MPKVKIALTKMRCLEETNEVGSDEPYVLVFAAKIKLVGGLVNVPSAHTVKYGPWTNVDQNDLVATSLSFGGKQVLPSPCFWGLDGKAATLNKPEDAIFLVALMENDDADTGGIRSGLHAQMFAAITSYANAGMSRPDMITKLKKDMKDVLTGITVTGLPNNDDLVKVAHLSFSAAAIAKAENETVVKNLELSGDGGKYRLRFEMKK